MTALLRSFKVRREVFHMLQDGVRLSALNRFYSGLRRRDFCPTRATTCALLRMRKLLSRYLLPCVTNQSLEPPTQRTNSAVCTASKSCLSFHTGCYYTQKGLCELQQSIITARTHVIFTRTADNSTHPA